MTDKPRADTLRWFTHFIALAILAATFYALVLNPSPFVVETDVKLWLTGLSGTASLYLFGDQMQRSSSQRTQRAFEVGLNTTNGQPIGHAEQAPTPTFQTFVCPVDSLGFPSQAELDAHMTEAHP